MASTIKRHENFVLLLVVSTFGVVIVNKISQSSAKFHAGNLNRSYTTALTRHKKMAALSRGVMWLVCANIIAFYGLFEMNSYGETLRKDGKNIGETISSKFRSAARK